MIMRLWTGWTTPDNADRYETLLRSTIFPGILERRITGFGSIELYRRPLEGEVEFVTAMRFTGWEGVEAFAGPDREASVVPAAARAVLLRFDERARHYEVRETRTSQGGSP